VQAEYTSVFDDVIICKSVCLFDMQKKKVFAIEQAENASDADFADALTDEFVSLPDGQVLRAEDGVTFER